MGKKSVAWTDQAKADLRAIDQSTALRILHAIARYLASGEGDVKRLQDIEPPEMRLRVGDYRVRFTEESGEGKEGSESNESEGTLRIHAVRNRKEAYR